MKCPSAYTYNTPAGIIWIAASEEGITHIGKQPPKDIFIEQPTPLTDTAYQQVLSYLNKTRIEFDLPLAPKGTAFQHLVWNAVLAIPYGKTATYGDIARRVGSPAAARAVGTACKNCPILFVIPCHRVIRKNNPNTNPTSDLKQRSKLLQWECY